MIGEVVTSWWKGKTHGLEEQESGVSTVLGGLSGVKRESCVRRNICVWREVNVMGDAFV